MTDGIISAINRDIVQSGWTMSLIQTNAALNSGNSGGPLLNCFGQVIGINTMKISAFSDSAGVEGLGFAIPSATVKEVAEQLIAQGYVSGRPRMGVTMQNISSQYLKYYNLPAGIRIVQVEADSPAQAAGLKAGDILLAVGSNRVTSIDEVNKAIYAHKPGDTVQLTLYRYGQQLTVNLTLGEAGA
jgi:serine protease Do